MRALTWPCRLSMAPFSWATPRLLRVGVTSGQLAQDRHRAQPGGCLEQRHDHLVPMTGQRVRPRAIGPRPPLGARRPRVVLDAPGGGDREAGLGRSGHLHVVDTKSHVDPHLLVVDVTARHPPLRCSEKPKPVRPAGEASALVGELALVGLRPSAARSPTFILVV